MERGKNAMPNIPIGAYHASVFEGHATRRFSSRSVLTRRNREGIGRYPNLK